MEILAFIMILPMALVLGIVLVCVYTGKQSLYAKSKSISNNVGCQTLNEITEAALQKREIREKKITPYDLRWLSYRQSLNEFIRDKYKEKGIEKWVARQPNTLLTDTCHKIKLFFKDGTIQEINVFPIPSATTPKFMVNDSEEKDKKPNPEVINEPKTEDTKKTSDSKAKKKTTEDKVKEKCWIEIHKEQLITEKEQSIKNGEDFFMLNEKNIPSPTLDEIESINEVLKTLGMFLACEEETYTINIM